MSAAGLRRAAPLALVHHANQYLITDGYDSREGLSEVVGGYAAVLRLHDRLSVPANLHLSGTLVESVAWHQPWFLSLVKELRAKGLLALIGGTYAENVMTLFSHSFNIRQLNELLWLYHRHLDCPPHEVKICWVPERVWDTEKLAPTLTSNGLNNGGYRYVLLDDRLLYPANGSYPGSPRAMFDSTGPYGHVVGTYPTHPRPHANAVRATANDGRPRLEGWSDPVESFQVHRIARADPLAMIPISANLRYWVPPACPDHWRHLEETVGLLLQEPDDHTLLVYADDLEKVAGVGPWDVSSLERYEAFLRWLVSREEVAPVLLPEWLAVHPARGKRELQAGTYFELAQSWRAGEDYCRWGQSATWAPYSHHLAAAQDTLSSPRSRGADAPLMELAWKHLLACSYETAWQDPGGGGEAPAPWARALASHARASLVIAAAACWFAQPERSPSAELADVDQDGETEVVLANGRLYAVLAPGRGGRLTHLFIRTPLGGALAIGNPADDWNWQEELNRFMDTPANHPGALAEVGFQHDRYRVSTLGRGDGCAFVEMANVQEGSRLHGTRKALVLASDATALVVAYRLPEGTGGLATEVCLSPDYYHLLREGSSGLSPYEGRSWHGFRNGEVAVWVGIAPGERTAWAEPARREVGHGLNLRVQVDAPAIHLLLGCGDTDEERCSQLLDEGRALLRRVLEEGAEARRRSARPPGGNAGTPPSVPH